MSRHIAILFHESDSPATIGRYAIKGMAETWRRDGHTVTYLFGVRKFVPADLILVHVDLSVVPEEYIVFAGKYPIVLNGKIRDIRKSTFSSNMLRKNDSYAGQVFVKSNFNFAGIPEATRLLKAPFSRSAISRCFARGVKALLRAAPRGRFVTPADYLVIKSLREVPAKWFKRDDLVIQKFCPELDGGLYHVRFYLFMGDRHSCVRLGSPEPVVNVRSSVSFETIVVHPEIERMRLELNFDYGKFDYVMHEGVPVLLDINKTIGTPEHERVRPELAEMGKYRAEGLYSYFR